jgi:acyl-coenzyme A synthetase/AMP-(fatty) acid ligase
MFLDRLHHHTLTQPTKIAIEMIEDRATPSQHITYGELEQMVLRTMALLRIKGVTPGDRVALQLPKCPAFVYLHLAIMRLGAISLPLNPGYPQRELAYFLEDAEVRLLIAGGEARNVVLPLAAPTSHVARMCLCWLRRRGWLRTLDRTVSTG